MRDYTYLKRWKLPRDYAGAEWPEYFVVIGRHRDSDCLANSNFECILKALGGESDTVRVVHENHWAVGWVEWIGIHESDEPKLDLAESILEGLDNYPVYDEQDWSEREQDEANETWRTCYRPSERIDYIRKHRSQFEFRNMADLFGCVRGKYFAGYASELLH